MELRRRATSRDRCLRSPHQFMRVAPIEREVARTASNPASTSATSGTPGPPPRSTSDVAAVLNVSRARLDEPDPEDVAVHHVPPTAPRTSPGTSRRRSTRCGTCSRRSDCCKSLPDPPHDSVRSDRYTVTEITIRRGGPRPLCGGRLAERARHDRGTGRPGRRLPQRGARPRRRPPSRRDPAPHLRQRAGCYVGTRG